MATALDPRLRDSILSTFRRTVYDKIGFQWFAHQAEWQLASEGWVLQPHAPNESDFFTVIQVADTADTTFVSEGRKQRTKLVPRQITPREFGPAHNLADLAAYKGGKALALSTPIPTPTGWTAMGDLQVGDSVIDDDGQPTRITATTPPHTDKTGTYRITFDDGNIIVASGEHEWPTADHRQRLTDSLTMRTTRSMMRCRNKHQQHRFGVPVAAAWNLSDATLPLHPYVLGAWLGDGTGITGVVTTADVEIIYEIEKAGFACQRVPSALYAWRVEGLSSILRSMHLLGNKHVPLPYLRSSRRQRLLLLQGLMDTDGSCEKKKGRVEFTNTNERLSRAVFQLAASLGLKPRFREKRATLYGKDCGPVYLVVWTGSVPVFRLKRKRDLLPLSVGGRVRYRYISKIERIPDQLVRCITVDTPSHLFLCGRAGIPTHNSYGGAAYLTAFAVFPDAHVQLIGAEYATSEPEFTYLTEFLCGERGMNLKHKQLLLDARGGRMRLQLKNGSLFECQSWENQKRLKGRRIDCFYWSEAYQLPGMITYNSVSQNLREKKGFSIWTTTPDEPWVEYLHRKGHPGGPDSDNDWHCTCGIEAEANPFTFDQAARDRDDPDKNGIMTRERFAIAWQGRLGTFVGRVYNYNRGQKLLSPAMFPMIWKEDVVRQWERNHEASL